MLEVLLHVLETIGMSLIIGGGIIMAACVRPLLLPLLSTDENPKLASTIEGISIKAWNGYNRYAFLASILLLLLEGIRFLTGLPFSYWHAGVISLIVLALSRKLMVDRQLSLRLQTASTHAIGSVEQNAGHRQVELLSKMILLLAIITVIVPR